jgi:UDP-N-acetylglucosamine acyltransferase
MSIHVTAIIDKRAKLGVDNEIGPYVVIEGPVNIGNRNKIGPHAIISGNTTIGDNNVIHGHVYLGNVPQDLAYTETKTFVEIGSNNVFREYSNVHRGTKEGSTTIIGDNNYFMVASHIAHNCTIGSYIIMANGASLGGYVEIHNHAFLSGFVIVHQFTRIGSYSICGFLSKITKDIPPYMMVDGNPARVRGINLVGLKRKGFDSHRRETIKNAYKILYRSNYSISSALGELKKHSSSEDIQVLMDFIKNSTRGILFKTDTSPL